MPLTEPEMHKLFSDEDYRKDLLAEVKEFENAKQIGKGSSNKRNQKTQCKKSEKESKNKKA